MRTILSQLINPLPLLLLLLLATFLFYRLRKRKTAKALGLLAILWFLMISTPWLPRLLLQSLERRYNPVEFAGAAAARNILVLASGYTEDVRLPFTAKLYPPGVTRLAEAARLQKLMPGSKLVFSGYGGGEPVAQAYISMGAAAEMGLDTTGSVLMPEPWNTRTEAKAYKARFGNKAPFYLVTDAAHMPRAMLHFRRAGLQPIPAPAAFMVKKSVASANDISFKPSSENIRNMEIVFHEYLGLLWANLGGD